MSRPAGGRLAILIPAYQCADRFGDHVGFLRGLRPLAAELIWAVTESADGTHDLARRAHGELGGKLLTTPRGLYSSWNAGIREATSEFIYISTVGEQITAPGIEKMIHLLREHQAHACFSPPEIFPAEPNSIKSTRHWPVFRFQDILQRYDRQVVPVPVLASLQAVSGISGLLGSCASCVFNTKLLQEAPFPTDFLHYGDTAWFFHHLCRIRTVYLSESCSTFHVHDFSKRQVRISDAERCLQHLAEDLRRLKPAQPISGLLTKLQRARKMTDHLREPHPFRFWWLNPSAWFWRIRRDFLQKEILSFASSFFHTPPPVPNIKDS